jgi:thiamine-phosphate pyrophosphorylase
MSRRQTLRPDKMRLPHVWLMTDPRFGDDLLPAIQRLPAGSGVIFRHYGLPPATRRELFQRVRTICRRRGHILLLAGQESIALTWHADGFHMRGIKRQSTCMIHSAPVHNQRELTEAIRNRCNMVLLSPMFATGSHPEAKPLGHLRFMALARQAGATLVIALGGMTARKAATLDKRTVHGWAAIDAFRR